jgi:hypothetical protein
MRNRWRLRMDAGEGRLRWGGTNIFYWGIIRRSRMMGDSGRRCGGTSRGRRRGIRFMGEWWGLFGRWIGGGCLIRRGIRAGNNHLRALNNGDPCRLKSAGRGGVFGDGLIGGIQGHRGVLSKPVVSGRPHIRFAFWTAWPAAPLPRLSIAPRAITVPVPDAA